jgi:hypothetical protein
MRRRKAVAPGHYAGPLPDPAAPVVVVVQGPRGARASREHQALANNGGEQVFAHIAAASVPPGMSGSRRSGRGR